MNSPSWFAIKSRAEFQLEFQLQDEVDAIFLPKETRKDAAGKRRIRSMIPGVLFIMTHCENALRLERLSHDIESSLPPFWIYRYQGETDIAPISPRDINLLRLLTAQDASRCEIYNRKDFETGQYVRVTGGIFQGQQGYVQRVRKNRHVVVKIEGLCAILLPYIHPDLLEIIGD